jgi:hypothetical protein
MYKLLALLFSVSLLATACADDCEPSTLSTCSETPPTNELCQAQFNRWFYNASTNTCSQISYTGCSLKGFATQAECEACGCAE